MNADERGSEIESGEFKHGDLTQKIIGVFYDVYNELGHGFLESVYQNSMLAALAGKGVKAAQKIPIVVHFRGMIVGEFEADLLVEDAVLLELKAVRSLDSAHESQLLNYLRATSIEIGLLLNFGPKPQIKRLAVDNSRKRCRETIDFHLRHLR